MKKLFVLFYALMCLVTVPGYSAGTKGNATRCSQRHLSRTKYTGIKTDAGR